MSARYADYGVRPPLTEQAHVDHVVIVLGWRSYWRPTARRRVRRAIARRSR